MRKLIVIAAASLLAAGSAQAAGLTDRPLVDVAWLEEHLNAEGLVILDIRDTPEGAADLYAAGHVPGAVAAPYATYGWRAEVDGTPGMLPSVETLEQKIGALGIDEDTHVVIVPAGENATDFGSATRVYWTFKVLGHDEVSILEGGHKAWTAAGKPLSTDAVTPVATDFDAAFRPQMIASTADVAAAIHSPVELVDARPTEQYLGQTKSGVVKTAGTIPGAANIANDLFYDGATGKFADKATIDRLLKQVGIADDAPQIAFCNTGHWASVAWFGLSEIAGKQNVTMYDGSLAQWTQDPANPMVVYVGASAAD
jgi:thiosulfate/3-mercaptopyruvate sulfurtransferase